MSTDQKRPYYNPEVWGGIECTINRVDNAFFDQLQYSKFYEQPQTEAIVDLGIKKLRFPILWEKHQPAFNCNIDWLWTQQQLQILQANNVDVIAGLVHHGSGPAFTNLLDDNFPEYLAAYAKEVAQQFPWIEYYTPVNEPLTTSRFSGLYGFWYPHHHNDRSFLKMLLNELKGTVLAMQEIRRINPKAKLVQTEDLGKTYSTSKLKYQARFENERRWLTFDLLCGRVTQSHPLWKYMLRNGVDTASLQFFIDNPCVPDIFGYNHYVTSERYLDENLKRYPKHTHGGNGKHRYADVEAVRVEVEEETGIQVLVQEAWERYKQPIAITEVHLHCHREEQLRWFKYVWDACKKLSANGVDIRGVTTWAIMGSYGWNKLLTEPGGDYEPGVFDMRSGTARPTALRDFIKHLTSQNKAPHPLSKHKGWWQRDCRYIYVSSVAKMKILKTKSGTKPVLIIGKNGTLGKAFAKVCEERFIPFQLLSRQECDIADPVSIEKAIALYQPWAIINAAGFVRVDDAEAEKDKCFSDNCSGAVNLAKACNKAGIQLVTFSSDLVFDGNKQTPYVEDDIVNPLNVYGQSKAQSEVLVQQINPQALIIRTSAFFGPWDKYNFIEYVIQNVSTARRVTVADDVLISPTYVPDLVHASLDLLVDGECGIWHLANEGVISWAGLAFETADRMKLDRGFINAVSLEELNYPAPRPKYSVLGSNKGYLLPKLENAMQRFFNEKSLHSISEIVVPV